jgi:hypothetical protein
MADGSKSAGIHAIADHRAIADVKILPFDQLAADAEDKQLTRGMTCVSLD